MTVSAARHQPGWVVFSDGFVQRRMRRTSMIDAISGPSVQARGKIS